MSCKPKCANSGSVDPISGKDLMISQKGNPKFKEFGIIHPQCESCLVEQIGKQAISDCIKTKEVALKMCEKALGIERPQPPPDPVNIKSKPGESFLEFKQRLEGK